MTDTRAFVQQAREQVEARLGELLSPAPGAPPRIVEAVRYAMLGAGKRLRPLLVLASGRAARPREQATGEAWRGLLDAACSIEMIHTFSLIHDDLPALDDDQLRRGRPTLHVRFDEATAILAGDALLNLAYETLGGAGADAPTSLRAIGLVSRAVGLEGMIGGQVLDLEAERIPVDADGLDAIHRLKTGALITASCELGGVMAAASGETIDALRRYGGHLGLAFQIVDDILDVEGSREDLGKSPGKDARAGKATFPARWGVEESRRRAAECVRMACEALAPMGEAACHLEGLARLVLTRRG